MGILQLPLQNYSCRNHPKVSARRKCFHCKAYLCPECQLKKFHHIFCNESCADHSLKKFDVSSTEKQLQALDVSLSDEIREQNFVSQEAIKEEVTRFEDNLDQALTTLATMVEGSSVAAASDLEKAVSSIENVLKTLDRENVQRDGLNHESQEKLKQVTLGLREMVLEAKEKVETLHQTLNHDLELIQGRFHRLDEATQEQLEISKKFSQELTEKQKQISKDFENHMEEIQNKIESLHLDRNRETKEIQESFKQLSKQGEMEAKNYINVFSNLENEFAESSATQAALAVEMNKRATHWEEAHQKSIQQVQQEMSKQLSLMNKEVQGAVQKELKRIVDDIAALTVAHRGNWNDVVTAANEGAVKATQNLRPEIGQKLKQEIERIAGATTQELSKSIRAFQAKAEKKVIGQPNAIWNAAIFTLIGGAIGLGSAWGIFQKRTAIPLTENREISSNLEANNQNLKEWVEEKLKENRANQESELIPALIPIPASTRGDPLRKEMSFTFDGDDNDLAAKGILTALKERNIRTTIFLTGNFILKHPDLVREIVQNGHEVGNHLMAHDAVVDHRTRKSIFSKNDFIGRLENSEILFEKTTGKKMVKFWRAPYGELNDEVIGWAASVGYRHVGWSRSGKNSLDTLDWVDTPKNKLYLTSDQIEQKINDFKVKDPNGLNGGIVLMHLGSLRSNDYPFKKLPEILDRLQGEGYKMVRVTELLRAEYASNRSQP